MKWIAVILVFVASLVCAKPLDAQLKVELKKVEDSVRFTSINNATVITIESKSGIGRAKLLRNSEGWPTCLIIRLKLKGLESFVMENGIVHFSTSLKSPRQIPYWKVRKNEKQPEAPDGTLQITMTVQEDAIEIGIPKELLTENSKEISFGWIDFYRD